MLVSEGREQWSDRECELWNNLHGAKHAVLFRGADHFTPTDAIWLGSYLPGLQVETGNIGPDKTGRDRGYVAAFFARTFPRPNGRLLNGISTEYAGVSLVKGSGPLPGGDYFGASARLAHEDHVIKSAARASIAAPLLYCGGQR
jgi:hypothetical protein